MGRRFGRSLLAIALAIAAPAVAACGADEASAAEIVRSAPAATVEADTARMSFSISMPGIPELGDTPFAGEGAMDVGTGVGSMSFDLGPIIEASGQQPPAGVPTAIDMVFEGSTYYMRFPMLSQALGESAAGKEWVKIDGSALASELGVDLSRIEQLGNDPRQQLTYLTGVSDDIEEVGDDIVRGVEVTHYRGTVSLDAVLDRLDEHDTVVGDAEAFREQAEALGLEEVGFDVWIDAEGRARRMDMAVPMPPESGVGDREVELTIEMYDFGAPVDVARPAPETTFDATALALQGG